MVAVLETTASANCGVGTPKLFGLIFPKHSIIMVTITKNALHIEMPGAYSAEDLARLNSKLIEALHAACRDGSDTFYILFELLEAISPTLEQWKLIYPHHGYDLS
jgi:hypothetical protein